MNKRWYALLVAVAMVGCGDDDGMIDVDGGSDGGTTDGSMMMPDSTTDAPPGMCADARVIELTAGAQQVTGDTSAAAASRTMSDGCGEEPTGQELLAFEIPGSGNVGVRFSLANDGTDFDTTVEVRPAGCDDLTDALCFDDVSLFEVRSEGSFIATGGTTVYLIVTGYDAESTGPWTMDVDVTPNPTAPVLTGGEVLFVDGARIQATLSGTDADGDVVGYVASFLDDSGAVIGLDLDEDPATPDDTELPFGFDADLSDMTTFTGNSRVGGLDGFEPLAAATQVRVYLYDAFDLESESMTFDLVEVTESGLEGPCVDGESICADAFVCEGEVCVIPDAAVDACEAATVVTLVPGTASVQTASIAAGDGALLASCGDTLGDEALYRVTVPAGAFDLIATTVRAANDVESVDTVVYVQSFCGDPGTEGEDGCSDDVGEEDLRSTVQLTDVAAGTYTVGVELWGGATEASTVELAITLRPVLAAGLPCDPTGAANRCADTECAGTPATCGGE
ncbi:MAG: hypothetical protein MUE69_05955 [Myxococcota bacterium]|jgi:hypothetical protein|nr:hypothetical protein [Myxococcota bacterium]